MARSPTRPRRYPKPKGRPVWRLDWFLWFLSHLTLPEGGPVVIDPWARFVLQQAFTKGRVELLVLLPKGNGKTTLFAGLAIFHLLTVRNPQVFIAAADVDQAKEMYRFARHFVESNPELHELLLVRPSTRQIRLRDGTGDLKVLASDKSQGGGKRHSFSPTLALIDELHAHENDEIYSALRSAIFKGKREGKASGLIVTISTAGHDLEGPLGKLRAQFLSCDQRGGSIRRDLAINARAQAVKPGSGRLTIATYKSGWSTMLEWACHGPDHPDGPDDLDDLKLVKLANPATFVTVASLVDAKEAFDSKPGHFARYRANVWLTDFESWLTPGAWAKRGNPALQTTPRGTLQDLDLDEIYERLAALFDQGASMTAAIDMARYRDCAAITCNLKLDIPVQKTLVWRSGGLDHPVPYEPIEQTLRWLDELYDVWAIGWDPRYFDRSAVLLDAEGLPLVKFDQSLERMSKASDEYRKAILGRRLHHDADPIFAAHVAAGTVKDVGVNQWRIVKKKKGGPPIDASIAGAMAHLLHLEAVDARASSGPLLEVL